MNIFELKQIERNFGKNKVLKGLDLNIPKGKIYGFLGRNGAGKTTTIKIILGLIKYHGGCMITEGKKVADSKNLFLNRVGSIVEFLGFYPNLNGYENLKVFQTLYASKEDSINKVLNIVGLGSVGKKMLIPILWE